MSRRKIKYIASIVIIAAAAACGTSEQDKRSSARQDALEQIKKAESEIHNSGSDLSMPANTKTALTALKAYSDFVTEFPQDTLNADFLFKSAEIYTSMKQYPEAYADYQQIEKYYPHYKLLEESIYLQGYLLDNFMNQDGKAKMVYEHLIEKYPDSKYVDDARAAINNLGKSDEELIKEFKKKNGEKD